MAQKIRVLRKINGSVNRQIISKLYKSIALQHFMYCPNNSVHDEKE